MLLETFFRNYASPESTIDAEFNAVVVRQHAAEVFARFLAVHGEYIDRHSEGLAGMLRSDLERVPAPFLWDASVGALQRSLSSDREIWPAACAAALQLHRGGVCGSWRVDAHDALRLRWAHWILPQCSAMHILSNGPNDTIAFCSGHGPIRLPTDGDGGDGLSALPSIVSGKWTLTLLNEPSLLPLDHTHVVGRLFTGDPSEFVDGLMKTIALLESAVPQYSDWVSHVVNVVIPLTRRPDVLESSSSYLSPGMIQVSADTGVSALAEMLVHEASHQYANILCRVGDIENGLDQRLYYSPIRDEERPLRGIVIAYHAFANVVLLYRVLRQSHRLEGVEQEYVERSEARLVPQLQELQRILQSTSGLSPIGDALWRPLASQL